MPCGMQILLSYVRAPNQQPDTSCLDHLLPVDFAGYGDRFGVETELGTTELWENTVGTVQSASTPSRAFVGPGSGVPELPLPFLSR